MRKDDLQHGDVPKNIKLKAWANADDFDDRPVKTLTDDRHKGKLANGEFRRLFSYDEKPVSMVTGRRINEG